METVNKAERRERIKTLRRQVDRNKRLPELLTNLSIIVGNDVAEMDVLKLEEIDKHEINLNSSDFDFNYLNISFPQEKGKELREKIAVLSSELNQTNYLTLHQWMEVAVMKVNTAFVVDNIAKLIALDKDSFYIYDLNYQNGLWIDLYADYWYLEGKAELRQILELRVFGKQWMTKMASVI
jgi:hypothetical protein